METQSPPSDLLKSSHKITLVFSAFSDTAEYLYKHVSKHIKNKYGLNTAVITGSIDGKTTIAVRMATSKAVKELIIKTGCPIFMSSANQSGEPTCTNLDEIENECPNLDGMMEGTVRFGKGSTIVDCVLKELKILRDGPITIEQIREVLKG